MTDLKIEELGKYHADFRMMQSNHIYDYKSCYDSYTEGMYQALTIYGVNKKHYYRDMIFATVIGVVFGILLIMFIN